MNKSYKSVWNEALGAWVAVSENSVARGKKSRSNKQRAFKLAASASLAAGSAFGMVSESGAAANAALPFIGEQYGTTNNCANNGSSITGGCGFTWGSSFTNVTGGNVS